MVETALSEKQHLVGLPLLRDGGCDDDLWWSQAARAEEEGARAARMAQEAEIKAREAARLQKQV